MRIIAQSRPFPHPGTRSSGAAVARAALLYSALATLSLLTGCIYHMPVRQGNYLDPAVVTQVRPGMTHSQVRYLLGTPMVPGAFDNSRWDYDYYLNAGLALKQRAHVTVYFQKDVVSQVVSDVKSAPVTTETRGGIKYPVPF
ncbi:MAG TPA: outer membrane protein assembly factor BamE [Steroidobacteraceae bacterium]|nr:outer membrane protein assembly factor BamE [Steroidobacteraceae bacterium]